MSGFNLEHDTWAFHVVDGESVLVLDPEPVMDLAHLSQLIRDARERTRVVPLRFRRPDMVMVSGPDCD